MGCIIRVARAVGAETMMHYVLRDRERVLDLFELLAGARFSLNFLRFGGVSADVTEGFIERVLETCELIRIRLKEYNDLFSFNQAYLRRSAFIGVIQPELARRIGMSGPNARASAITMDVRKEHPYCGYERLDFEVPLGQGEGGTIGDAHDRLLLRLREIAQSLEILKQVADFMPQGEFAGPKVGRDFKVPQGEAYVRVESSRGLLGCHVVSDGRDRPARVQFRAPSSSALICVPAIVAGSRIEDLPVILSSLDVCVAEVDR
jgi:NADH-quinone oxidoreductase subunit D